MTDELQLGITRVVKHLHLPRRKSLAYPRVVVLMNGREIVVGVRTSIERLQHHRDFEDLGGADFLGALGPSEMPCPTACDFR